MNRRDKMLYGIDRNGHGIEIGPSYNPVAPKKAGYKTHIIDVLNREELVDKYTGHGVNLLNIEEVDFVWRGESYAELTGKRKFYDWIIASHVIEHTPDLIRFLNDCDEVLRDDGVLSLAVPDKRYCFDYYRPATGIAKVIDSHLQGHTRHTPGTMLEFYLNVAKRGGKIAWHKRKRGTVSLIYSLDVARDQMNRAAHEKEYMDAHAWCFTPHSFRLMMHDLYSLGLIPIKEASFFATQGCEFFVSLGRSGPGIPCSRRAMLERAQAEA